MQRIAIDGPAAAGKSTVGQALAVTLGYLYVDTGAMYRAVTWLALHRGIDVADEDAITSLAERARFVFPTLESAEAVNPPLLINGIDVTAGLHAPDIDATVSLVSRYPGVRASLRAHQRALAEERCVVMVGRDIGRIVLPMADLKIYLTALPEERARRRTEEMLRRGQPVDYEEVLDAVRRRDKLDSVQMQPATDAVRLDTTGMEAPEVVTLICGYLPPQPPPTDRDRT